MIFQKFIAAIRRGGKFNLYKIILSQLRLIVLAISLYQ